jgi:hypothetical protein
VNCFTWQALPAVNREHFFMDVLLPTHSTILWTSYSVIAVTLRAT